MARRCRDAMQRQQSGGDMRVLCAAHDALIAITPDFSMPAAADIAAFRHILHCFRHYGCFISAFRLIIFIFAAFRHDVDAAAFYASMLIFAHCCYFASAAILSADADYFFVTPQHFAFTLLFHSFRCQPDTLSLSPLHLPLASMPPLIRD
jgi:hypothetical protein